MFGSWERPTSRAGPPRSRLLFISLSAAQYNLESDWADAGTKVIVRRCPICVLDSIVGHGRRRNAPFAHHGDRVSITELKLKYQRTHRTTISRSKCRPLNSSSTGTNRGIRPSLPNVAAFAPEPCFRHTSKNDRYNATERLYSSTGLPSLKALRLG